MLFGRADEQATIDQLLGAASQGHSSALVIRGEAGIGKSALLDYAEGAAGHSGGTILRVLAAPFEAQLPFAGLHVLLHPVLDRAGQLPAAQAEALRDALALGAAAVRDRFLVGLAALTLLSDLAAGGPVLCLVDDAQWLDDASTDALLFAARRLQAEGIMLLFAARDEPGALLRSGLPELRLPRLGDVAAEALITARAGDLAPQVRRRILQEADGNPLALVELPAALTPEQRSGRLGPLSFAVETGSASSLLRDGFLAQIARLAEPTQTVLLVAAADDTGELATILRAAAELGASVPDLEPAERAGLVRVSGTQLAFRHPLVRSAAYQAAPHHQRLAAHLALAAALDGEAHTDRRAWHLATGTVGPDQQVADALERTAVRARERQDAAAASAAYERAAELSPDDHHRAARLVAAAELAVQAGQLQRAVALADRAGAPTGDPYVQARLTHVVASVGYEQGSPSQAGRILVEGARRLVSAKAGDAQLGADNTATATRMLVDAVRNASLGCDPGLVCAVDAALSALEDSPLARAMCTVARVVGDEAVADVGPIRAAVEFLRGAPDEIWDQHLLAASLGLLIGDEAVAFDVSAGLAAYCRRHGMIGVLPQALGLLARAQVVRNRFDAAKAAATEALAIAADIGQAHRAGDLRALLAWLAAVAGEEQTCLAYVAQLGDAGPAGQLTGTWATGLLYLGRGQPVQALDQLTRLWDRPDRPQPLALYAAPDLIEAAVRSGRPDAAKEPLHRLEDWAAAVDRPWAAAVVDRCRGLLCDGPEAEHWFVSSIRWLEATPDLLFERARTQLAYGEWLRRTQRRADARRQIRAAFGGFDLLGATPWTHRAGVELQATGDTGAPRARGPAGRLTPQELQVVRLAARGKSNREIGAELFLSPRTVGHHLYKAYPKLGVSSRCQLAELDLDGVT